VPEPLKELETRSNDASTSTTTIHHTQFPRL